MHQAHLEVFLWHWAVQNDLRKRTVNKWTDLHCMLYLVILKIAKNNSSKDFCFKWGVCWCSRTTQNSGCSQVLHETGMVHGMSSTRNCKLQLKNQRITTSELKLNMDYKKPMLLLAIVTWRRANAAQALSIDDWFRSMVMNLPISAPLSNNKSKIR